MVNKGSLDGVAFVAFTTAILIIIFVIIFNIVIVKKFFFNLLTILILFFWLNLLRVALLSVTLLVAELI